MKDFIKCNWIRLSVLGICLFGISMGLVDLDYIWQRDLGKAIVLDLDFNSCYKQIWGSIGVSPYYDHEWLTNIIFYLFSLIPFKPLIWLKLFICILTGIETIRFVEKFGIYTKSATKIYTVLLVFAAYMLILCKIKAYSLSVILFMEEIILIEQYRQDEKLSYIIRLGVLCVLWNNLHSGSIPMYFLVAFVYYLVYFRTKKLFLQGIVIALCTLINPYGYKLLLFDIQHFSDSTMKYLLADWQSIDTGTEIGMFCAVIVLIFILISKPCKSMSTFVLGRCIIFMCMGSARHIIYLFPLFYITVLNCDSLNLNYRFYFMRLYVTVFSTILGVLAVVTVFTYSYDEYSMNFVSDELKSLIETTIDDESTGLFNDHDYISMTEYNKKNFVTGAYPMDSARVKDSGILLRYGTSSQIQSIINYYGLDKFIFNKQNTSVPYYTVNNNLYEYLSTSDDYECLYDSDILVYFRKKVSE